MTTITIAIEEGHEEDLKKILDAAPFKTEIIEGERIYKSQLNDPQSAYEKLIKIQEEIGDQKLFPEIKDASEWQREIRKEWDRDF